MGKSVDYRLTRLFFAVTFGGTILLSFLWTLQGTRRALLLLGITVFTALGLTFLSFLYRQRKPFDWFMLLAVLNLFFVLPELGLRMVDFHYKSGAQFGYPRPSEFWKYVPDEKLFWKLPPDAPGVNSLGFAGPEMTIPKPAHVYRILYLGDSCTRQGYPRVVQRFLNAERCTDSLYYESVILALTGYSSHQGRVLAELYGAKLQPDLVVIYFGWNDHWLAYGAPDAQKTMPVPHTVFDKTFEFVCDRSRLMQFIKKIWVVTTNPHSGEPLDEVRVPVDDYRRNLVSIAEIFTALNVPVVFITAPTSMYRSEVSRPLLSLKHESDEQSVITIHKKYNEIVRDVTQEKGAYLLDLERTFNTLLIMEDVFLSDGIHFTDFGTVLVA